LSGETLSKKQALKKSPIKKQDKARSTRIWG